MFRKEINAQSPLRILEKSIHGGLGQGNVGILMAGAGVGKTASLVQIGLDSLLRGQTVLHVALGNEPIAQVEGWYDTLFDDLTKVMVLEDAFEVKQSVRNSRIIQSYRTRAINPRQIEKSLHLLAQHLDFKPNSILIDGYDWEQPLVKSAANLGALKNYCDHIGAELWMTAKIARTDLGSGGILPPCQAYEDILDVVLLLEPEGEHVCISLVKDHDNPVLGEIKVQLEPKTMRLVHGHAEADVKMPAHVCTLLSGAALGAEAVFGEFAEKWGLSEQNYTFKGRGTARTRGLVVLDDNDLQAGAVSTRYVEEHMHRRFPDTPLFQKLLQSIWHQVNTANQVFVIGTILEDQTVKGGTGWAAELGKLLKKRVHVYDQESKTWFRWNDTEWVREDTPAITARRFCGTGSRHVSDEARAAVKALFLHSFGPAK